MDWIIPDGQNKKLRDHRNKSMSEGTSPDGGPTKYINLSNLGLYFSSSNFLIDMVMGYVFVPHKRRLVQTGLTCTQNQTPPEEMGVKIQEASNMYWNKLIEKNETNLQRISNKDIRRNILNETAQIPTPQPVIMAQPPTLPRIDNPELYTIHDEPMPLRIRRTYIMDQMQNAHTYIMEYSAMLEMVKERRYLTDDLWHRLRIIYGRVDEVRRNIDGSLATDDRLRRQRGMTEFRIPYRFPDLMEMENSMPLMWIQWISREANELCNELTLIIDQEMNEILSEFRPILEDIEPERENQPDLMGFETPWPGNENGVPGEEGNSPQQGLYEHQNEPQSENSNTTQVNVCQTTETAANNAQKPEERGEHHRLQQNGVVSENTQEQNGQVSQNHTHENTRSTIENNVGNTTNTNLSNNQHNTIRNNTNVPQVLEDRSKNSQIYFERTHNRT